MKKIDSGYCKKCGDQKVNNKCPHCVKPKLASCAPLAEPKQLTIALEDIYIGIIQTFCENLAEAGLPKDVKECDMWWRYLTYDQKRAVVEKLMEIEERNYKLYDTK